MFEFIRIPEVSSKLKALRTQNYETNLFESKSVREKARRAKVRSKEEVNYFAEKLVRLIPSEAVGLYLFAQGLIGTDRKMTLVVWSVFCLFIAGLIRYLGSKTAEKNSSAQWGAILIACVSYVIWLYNIGGPFRLVPNLYDPIIASLIMAGWTTLTTLLYEPRENAS